MPTVIDSLVVELGLDPAKFSKGQKDAVSDLKKFQDSHEKSLKEMVARNTEAGYSFASLRTQAVAALAIFTAGRGVSEFAKSIATTDASVARTGRSFGLSTESLSQWRGAVAAAGGSADGITASITGLVNQFAQMSLTGESSVIPYFRSMGIEIADANGKMIPFEQTLFKMAKWAEGRNPAEATAMFSNMGMDAGTINLLLLGTEKMTALLEVQRKIGLVQKENGDSAEGLVKSWNNLTTSAEALGRTVLTALAPALTTVMDRYGSILKDMSKGNIIAPGSAADWILGKMGTAGYGDQRPAAPPEPPPQGPVSSIPTPAGGANMAWRKAIGNIESRSDGGYAAVGPVIPRSGDRAYGKYQIMGNNIGDWSQAALGRRMTTAEFMASPEAQDKIFDHRFGSYVQKYGSPQDAASAWLTGKPRSPNNTATDPLGTNSAEYVRRFNAEGGNVMGGAKTSTATTSIGSITVNTQATDAAGIAGSIKTEIQKQNIAQQADVGVQ